MRVARGARASAKAGGGVGGATDRAQSSTAIALSNPAGYVEWRGVGVNRTAREANVARAGRWQKPIDFGVA
jgi:hypothetical protein